MQGKAKLLTLLHSSSESCLAKLGARIAALRKMFREPGDLARLNVTLSLPWCWDVLDRQPSSRRTLRDIWIRMATW